MNSSPDRTTILFYRNSYLAKFASSNFKMHMKNFLTILFACFSLSVFAQPDRWQQKVKYTMNIDMNVQTNQYTGKQKLEYWNNSPDTLNRVFFHLYWNAFRPGS